MSAKRESTWKDLQDARENLPSAVRVVVHLPQQRQSKENKS